MIQRMAPLETGGVLLSHIDHATAGTKQLCLAYRVSCARHLGMWCGRTRARGSLFGFRAARVGRWLFSAIGNAAMPKAASAGPCQGSPQRSGAQSAHSPNGPDCSTQNEPLSSSRPSGAQALATSSEGTCGLSLHAGSSCRSGRGTCDVVCCPPMNLRSRSKTLGLLDVS